MGEALEEHLCYPLIQECNLDQQAQDRLERMIDQMKAAEGITEALKASDPMAWAQRMNNIRFRVEEIIREELIYV